MKKTALAITILLVLSLSEVAGIKIVRIARADPFFNIPVPHIGISWPPHQSFMKYVNSTVELKIYVNMFLDSPQLKRISYSLDGGPVVDIDNFTVKNTKNYFGDKSEYTSYEANATLENLAEGNHTITAYAGSMSTSRTFTVNSHYVLTEIKVLSPTNQTYLNTVPLVFTVNVALKEAHYSIYRSLEYDAFFKGSCSGNTTLDNLSQGSYVMYIYVTTEDGQAMASTSFYVLNDNYSRLYAMFMIAAIMVGAGFGLLLYFKKRKR